MNHLSDAYAATPVYEMFSVGDNVTISADTLVYSNEGLAARHPYTTIFKATNAVVIARRSDGWARVQCMARTTPFQREVWVECRHLSRGSTDEDSPLSDFKEQVRDQLIADLAAESPRLLGMQLEAFGLEPYEEPPPVAGTVVSLKGGDIAVYLPEFYDTLQWATFDPCDVEWVSNEWVRANRS